MNPDFIIRNEGALVGFEPRSDRACEWLDDNVDAEPWQYLGPTLMVDYRMAQALVDGIIEVGFEVVA